jgi:hypothetical protein
MQSQICFCSVHAADRKARSNDKLGEGRLYHPRESPTPRRQRWDYAERPSAQASPRLMRRAASLFMACTAQPISP